ncbi:hypothetical protein HHE014_08770 [Helicobacter heilmannii]|uniref:Uncharacterized protein n=1 Tax=Helicobacter heilmannii TaxID=35817 RepID=A0A0K2XHF0_HELHE|nr:hypothetical protein [Helicobacter heilmannii]GLH58545.1 hypothetical protein NHP214376_13360 [Helicobacter ailurogastricus]CRF45898.1 hypothetical protein HHE014_08770 [Helicobacter heilmannii]CRI35321.1 hypothetical protein HHE01_03190 [Helicobacter heilmannii]BDQ28137.1 hypothetical protein ASB1_18130 [Helicobacter heilmannii]GLH60027.1 hypothetical protein NHP214377_12990 [Helicobacter ailurogastricus]
MAMMIMALLSSLGGGLMSMLMPLLLLFMANGALKNFGIDLLGTLQNGLPQSVQNLFIRWVNFLVARNKRHRKQQTKNY